MAHHEPKIATRFHDHASGRDMLLNHDPGDWKGWLFCRHPDGQWAPLRKATLEDCAALLETFAQAYFAAEVAL